MSDYNSNYDCVCCPYCSEKISEDPKTSSWVDSLEDEDYDFFQCSICQNFFKAQLDIYKEYEYSLTKPSKEEIKKHGLIVNKNKDIIEDCPGQIFIWKDLLTDKS